MNSKILPSLVVAVLATCVLHNSRVVKPTSSINNTGQQLHNPAGYCPSAAPAAKAANSDGAAKEVMSSYPSIMYVDM